MTTSSIIEIDAMNLQKRVDQYEVESGELHQEIDNLNRVLREKSAYEDRLVANNSRLLERNNQLFKQVAELQSEVGNLNNQVFSLNKLHNGKISLLEADIEQSQAVIDQHKLREKEMANDNQALKNSIELYKKDAELNRIRHARDEAEEQLAGKTAELLELNECINKTDIYQMLLQLDKFLKKVNDEMSLLDEIDGKINYLRRALIIEADPSVKFNIEKKLEELEIIRKKIDG